MWQESAFACTYQLAKTFCTVDIVVAHDLLL
jgi:hypothetical protein